MTKLSRDERRNVVEAFYERVSDGVNIDPDWMRQMIEDGVPALPEDPTPEQCDAWIELSGILSDPEFAANMRTNAKDIWDGATFDLDAWKAEGDAMVAKAAEAIALGVEPTSETARALAKEWLEVQARLTQRKPDADFRIWIRAKYQQHDVRATRYWELVAILRGQSPCSSPSREWMWMGVAITNYLADAPA
jgi:hypothetical protein